jgi:hypothetical protein
MLNVIILNVAFFYCYAEYYYAQCCYAECRYADCRGAIISASFDIQRCFFSTRETTFFCFFFCFK